MSAPQNKSFPVSWDQFHRDSRALAWRLNAEGPFDAIVCITRGGLVPAAIIARELGIRVIESVSVASYDNKDQGELKVLKPVAENILAIDASEDGKILIIDDLVDTGKTGRAVQAMLPNAHFATVYAKPLARDLVNSFVTEVSQDTWIYFPWDMDVSYAPPIRDGVGD